MSYPEKAEHMKRIASVQIRSVASWAGNLMLTRQYPTFASDMATILAAAGAQLTVMNIATQAHSVVSVTALMGMTDDFLVVSMVVPALPPFTLFETFKTSQRHVFAHAIVNLGGCITLNGAGRTATVTAARVVVGGATVSTNPRPSQPKAPSYLTLWQLHVCGG
jgi:CO/xanthine dehydrogenase FAD-binding subunit